MNERMRTGEMIKKQSNTAALGETPVPVPLRPPKIPRDLALDRTRVSMGRSRRLHWLIHVTAPDSRPSERNMPTLKVLLVFGLYNDTLSRVTGRSVNDELERFWTEAAMIRHLPGGTGPSILSSFLSHPVRIRFGRISTPWQCLCMSVHRLVCMLTFWRRNFFFQILAHPVFKM